MLERIEILILLGLAVILGMTMGGQAERPAQPPAPDPEIIARGVEVYRSSYCGVCHTLTAANTRGTFGPPHDNAGADAARHLADPRYRGAATTPQAYIRESLLEPGAFYTPGYESTNHHMPAFIHLAEEDIDALVIMLASQRAE